MRGLGSVWLSVSILLWLTGCGTGSDRRGGILEQTDVFVAGQDGIFEYRIPGLVTSNKGTLIAFCDARVKKRGDPPNNIDLVMKRSTDGGKTWSPLKTLVDVGEGAAADSCGLVDRQTGTIWIFSVYCPEGVGSSNAAVGLSGATFNYKGIKSDDDGETWSEPIDITPMVKKPEWSAGSTGVGKGIQMRSGRLILPRYYADYHRPGQTPGDEAAYAASFVNYSDDHGQTWKIGDEVPTGGKTNECQVAELSDGSLVINMRGTIGNRRKIARTTSSSRFTVAFDTPSASFAAVIRSIAARLMTSRDLPPRWRSSHRRCILSVSIVALWLCSLSHRTTASFHVRRGRSPSLEIRHSSAFVRS